MTDATAWNAAADPARRVGHRVEHHDVIGSTNDRARALLSGDAGEGVAVVAEYQAAGRGRRGRRWETPPGVNLMVSVPVRPALAPDRIGLLGISSALAVRDACATLVPRAALLLRWPNDVVAADGSKVAGVLLETTLSGERVLDAVIGIGINANWRRDRMPDEIRDRATSLLELAGAGVDRVTLLATLLEALDRELRLLEEGLSPAARFEAASALNGRLVTVELGGEAVEGVVSGIAPDGALLLTDGGRLRSLAMGEVVRVHDPPGVRDASGVPA